MSSKNVVWVVRAENRDGECYFHMAFSERATAKKIYDMGRTVELYYWSLDSIALNDTENAIKDINDLINEEA